MVDFQTIFCDGQVVERTTLSNRGIDLQSLADYAIGRSLYAQVVLQGTLTRDLRVQILGADNAAFTDATVIGDSGVIDKGEFNANGEAFVQFNPTGKKYRYVTLRFIPTLAEGESDTGTEVPGSDVVADVPEVGSDVTPVNNAIRAQIAFVPHLNIIYPVANADKGYSA